MHGHLSDVWSFGMGLSWLWMIVFWGLLIWGAVSLFRLALRLPELAHHRSEPPARRILRKR